MGADQLIGDVRISIAESVQWQDEDEPLKLKLTPSTPTKAGTVKSYLTVSIKAAEESITTATPIIKADMVLKEGGNSLASKVSYNTSLMWQSRYLEVRPDIIVYKETQHSKQSKGIIRNLQQCQVYSAQPQNASRVVDPSAFYFNVFSPNCATGSPTRSNGTASPPTTVTGGGRTYKFKVKHEVERDGWVQALVDAGCILRRADESPKTESPRVSLKMQNKPNNHNNNGNAYAAKESLLLARSQFVHAGSPTLERTDHTVAAPARGDPTLSPSPSQTPIQGDPARVPDPHTVGVQPYNPFLLDEPVTAPEECTPQSPCSSPLLNASRASNNNNTNNTTTSAPAILFDPFAPLPGDTTATTTSTTTAPLTTTTPRTPSTTTTTTTTTTTPTTSTNKTSTAKKKKRDKSPERKGSQPPPLSLPPPSPLPTAATNTTNNDHTTPTTTTTTTLSTPTTS
eukprot:TRINITY_DN5917_c1_g1_i2.p1 TRINITY_DN5917_c1_g1~~TRINITY_DN5917_c1_g1_i2.p1  ORF type:complete len:455 (-),score=121.28 TRINITY_DN5917_c1_g1_i2:62-1426(-)